MANGQHAVLGSQVACRDAPSDAGAVVTRLDVGNLVKPAAAPSDAEDWIQIVSDGERSCFMPARLPTPFDPEAPELALKAIVSSTDTLTGRLRFVHMINVSSLFENRWQDIRVEGSMEMEWLQLLVLERTMNAIPRLEQERPAVLQWLDRNQPTVFVSEFDGGLAIHAGAYWYVHDKYAPHPWADSIAWLAAQRPVNHDCAGSLPCWLFVLSHELGYIQRYPTGAFVPEALARLAKRLERRKGDFCNAGNGIALRKLVEAFATALGRVDHALARAAEIILYDMRQRCIPE